MNVSNTNAATEFLSLSLFELQNIFWNLVLIKAVLCSTVVWFEIEDQSNNVFHLTEVQILLSF